MNFINRSLNGIKKFAIDFHNVFWHQDMLVLPGHLAFFFFLSTVPIITMICYFAASFDISIELITDFITNRFGHDIANMLIPLVESDFSFGYFLTLMLGFFVASNGASSIIVSSNKIYGIKDSGFLKRRLKAIIMTFIIVVLFMFILLMPLFGSSIIEMIKYLDLSNNTLNIISVSINIISGPVSWFVIFFMLKFIYTMAPDKKIPSSYTTYGALFTSISWIIVTQLYSVYIGRFAHYDVFYGGLANIVILMLWVYLLAYTFVIGIGLNNKLELDKTGNMPVV